MLHLKHHWYDQSQKSYQLIVLLVTPEKALGYFKVSSTPKKQNVLFIMYEFHSCYTVRPDIQRQNYAAVLLFPLPYLHNVNFRQTLSFPKPKSQTSTVDLNSRSF